MMDTEAATSYEVGDTFHDARDNRSDTVRIVSIDPTGQCFQLRWSRMDEFELCPYVTGDRLSEITGGAAPVFRKTEETPENIDHFDPEVLTPAEYTKAHVYPRSDGSVLVKYFAWAEALDRSDGSECRALRNEVTGKFLFDEKMTSIAPVAAQMIAADLYPYRLSPDTHISATTFPEKRTLLERLRPKVFGGPSFVPSDDLTKALEVELNKLAKAAAPSASPILTDWG
jgi:hypothetical protein